MTDRELMQMALDALEDVGDEWGFTSQRTLPKRMNVIEALRARLSQPEQEQLRDAVVYGTAISKGGERIDPASIYKQSEQEPVAWVECDGQLVWNNREAAIGRNLYTAPPQREWQGLTDEEIDDEYFDNWSISRMRDFAHAIEAKLKGKNT